MRTIISFLAAIFIHLGVVYFLLPKRETAVSRPQAKLSTIDLTQFNLQKKSSRSSSPAAPGKETLAPAQASASASAEGASAEATGITGTAGAAIGPGSTAPALIFLSFVEPEYPRIARVKGLEGKVKIKVIFNNQGSAANVEILESSTHSILDEAVKKAALQWVLANKQDSTLEKTFEFRLKN